MSGMRRAPTPVTLVYVLLSSALMRGRINPHAIDADCAFGLLKLLQEVLGEHNKLSPLDRALDRRLVGLESVREKSQDARDALHGCLEPLRADPAQSI